MLIAGTKTGYYSARPPSAPRRRRCAPQAPHALSSRCGIPRASARTRLGRPHLAPSAPRSGISAAQLSRPSSQPRRSTPQAPQCACRARQSALRRRKRQIQPLSAALPVLAAAFAAARPAPLPGHLHPLSLVNLSNRLTTKNQPLNRYAIRLRGCSNLLLACEANVPLCGRHASFHRLKLTHVHFQKFVIGPQKRVLRHRNTLPIELSVERTVKQLVYAYDVILGKHR